MIASVVSGGNPAASARVDHSVSCASPARVAPVVREGHGRSYLLHQLVLRVIRV